jgi:hypothetical protein
MKAIIKQVPQVSQGEFYLDEEGDLNIIARVDRDQFNIIGLRDGNRWTDAFPSLAALSKYVREKGWKKLEVQIEVGGN